MLKLPKLKIIHIDDLILHEEFSRARADKLAGKIRNDGCLKNPVIASYIKDIGRYLVLDGATRTTALRSLGFRDVLVQLVDYDSDSVTLDTWHHIMPDNDGMKTIASIALQLDVKASFSRLDNAAELLRKRLIMSYFLFFDNTCLVLEDGGGKPSEKIRKMREMVLEYEKHFPVNRIHFNEITESLKRSGKIMMANVFPAFSKREIIRLAQSELLLPAGISRHIIPGRVLGFSIGNELLQREDKTLSEKNEMLDELCHKKLTCDQVRFYSESVFIFNEY